MSLRDIDFPPKDEPLRLDVGRLGDLVGEVIREQSGDALFERVEAARTAAIRRREAHPRASGDLTGVLRGLDEAEVTELVRAFSTYFQVVNLAERVHRVRRGRWWMRSEEGPQAGSFADTVRRLGDLGLGRAQVRDLFSSARVEPVFTAHPTEATRRAILVKQEWIALELLGRSNPERTPREERIAYYVSRTLYRVLPALHEALEEALDHVFGPAPDPDEPELPSLVSPGSWVGGDMDGNPNVDARTMRETLDRHRDLALTAYERDVAELAMQLTQSASRVAWSQEVDRRIERYAAWFPEAAAAIPDRHRAMGYRVLLELIGTRLRATASDGEHAYDGPKELLADIRMVAYSLTANRGQRAGLFAVRRLVRRIGAFGFHMATLDVREDARALRDVVAELRSDPAWPDRMPEDRAERLRADLTASDFRAVRARFGAGGEAARRALDVFRTVADARSRYGPDAIGYYIISMAEDVDDALTVLWLAAVAGMGSPEELELDVAPLFETVPDLGRAEHVLRRMFTDPVLRPHIDRRAGRQLVMVGYSDSNKDGGIASARWALQRALERMAVAATEHEITLTVFHGRGGTVSRGGGSVHQAVAAMPPAAIGGRLRLTEQGEVIDAKYGLPQIALRELERMLGAIVLRQAAPGPETPPEWRALADTVADTARTAYRALVYEDPRFTPYFRSATPIDVIERMAIGSRPASRRQGAGVEDLRAIPWVFSWTQCRAMLTGWYGLGSGLETALGVHGVEALRDAAAGWPFLDALLADVEMVLAKADLDIAAMYQPLAPEASRSVFDSIRTEFDRTIRLLLDIRGSEALLDRDPTLQRSIRLRNPYVDPMNCLQVDLLGRWRDAGRPDGPLLEALLSTVNGIARGLQNTG